MFSSSKSKHIAAALVMFLGTSTVFGTVVVMNHFTSPPEKKVQQKETTFLVRNKPKQQKKKPKPKPRKRREATKQRNLKPSINSQIAGASFGIDALEGALGAIQAQAVSDADADLVMTEDAVDVKPRPSGGQWEMPGYPPLARKRGVEGYVKLFFVINTEGRVEQVQILEAQPEGVFEDAAMAAIRKQRFEPAKYKGQAVFFKGQSEYNFSLGG